MSMIAAIVGTLARKIPSITVSGSLDATAVSGISNSVTRIVTVPDGNPGDVSFESFSDVGTIVASQYNKAGAGLVGYTDPTEVRFVSGNSLLLRTTGNGPGESRTLIMRDVTTGATISTVVHTGG